MEKAEITFAVRGREYFEGLVISSWKRIPARLGLLVAGFLILFSAMFITRVTSEGWLYLVYGAFFLMVFATLLLAAPAWQSFQYSRNKKLSAEKTWTFSRERIIVRSESGESKVTWKSFAKPVETRNLFILFSSTQSRLIYIFPKRAFPGKTQIDGFREMIRKSLGKIS